MKQMLLTLITCFAACILMSSSCERKEKIVEVIKYEVDIDDPLELDHKSGETVILMGKLVPPKSDGKTTRYQYYISALGGTWIETNTKFGLGDTLILGGKSPATVDNEKTIVISSVPLDKVAKEIPD